MIDRPNTDSLYSAVSREVGEEETVSFTAENEVVHLTGVDIIFTIAGILITSFLKGFLEEPITNAGKKWWSKLSAIIKNGLIMKSEEQKKAVNEALR